MGNMRTIAIGSLLAGAIIAAPVHARIVEYDLDLAAIEAAAVDQGIDGPFSPEPGSGNLNIALIVDPSVDHIMKNVSINCQAFKVENPIGQLMLKLVAAWDNDGSLATPGAPGADLTIHLKKGLSMHRCLGQSDLEGFCKNRTSMAGEVEFAAPDGTMRRVPISVQVERGGRVGMFCGNLARFTGIVSREAGIALLAEAGRAYEAARSSTATTAAGN